MPCVHNNLTIEDLPVYLYSLAGHLTAYSLTWDSGCAHTLSSVVSYQNENEEREITNWLMFVCFFLTFCHLFTVYTLWYECGNLISSVTKQFLVSKNLLRKKYQLAQIEVYCCLFDVLYFIILMDDISESLFILFDSLHITFAYYYYYGLPILSVEQLFKIRCTGIISLFDVK